ELHAAAKDGADRPGRVADDQGGGPVRAVLRSPGRSRLAPTLTVSVLLIGAGLLGPAADAPGQATAARPDSERVPEALNFANGLFRARRFDLAAQEYRRFLQTDPPASYRAEALYGLAN